MTDGESDQRQDYEHYAGRCAVLNVAIVVHGASSLDPWPRRCYSRESAHARDGPGSAGKAPDRAGAARTAAGGRPGPDRGLRLRGLPHRPPHRRRRAHGAQAAARPRAPDRRASGGRGEGRGPVRRRRPGGRALARLDRRDVSLLPLRPREPLREREVHGLRHRRWLRRAGRGRRALLLPAARRHSGRSRRASALRRPDRLPLAPAGRRGRPPGPIRLRLVGTHHLPGSRRPGLACISP